MTLYAVVTDEDGERHAFPAGGTMFCEIPEDLDPEEVLDAEEETGLCIVWNYYENIAIETYDTGKGRVISL